MLRKVRSWWWKHSRGARECVPCGFVHPHPERFHRFPYGKESH